MQLYTCLGAFKDTTGIMTCVCSHDIIRQVLQLEHGERYAYGLFMFLHTLGLIGLVGNRVSPGEEKLNNSLLLGETGASEVVTARIYDLNCRFNKYLINLYNNLSHNNPLKQPIQRLIAMPSATGVAHVLGHQLRCQLFDSARCILGMGITCGENCERAQSRLIGYIRQLKHCGPLRFRELLASIVEHNNHEKILELPTLLRNRYRRAIKLRTESIARCSDHVLKLPELIQSECSEAVDIHNVWEEALQHVSALLSQVCASYFLVRWCGCMYV